ncbi:hypothetical protein B0H14DRAFT_3163455 [Mycena olivaceomarginata]|nr:hypothetical protein B0H14DRAFT_3163455 [Mycena olivaceomarginata]
MSDEKTCTGADADVGDFDLRGRSRPRLRGGSRRRVSEHGRQDKNEEKKGRETAEPNGSPLDTGSGSFTERTLRQRSAQDSRPRSPRPGPAGYHTPGLSRRSTQPQMVAHPGSASKQLGNLYLVISTGGSRHSPAVGALRSSASAPLHAPVHLDCTPVIDSADSSLSTSRSPARGTATPYHIFIARSSLTTTNASMQAMTPHPNLSALRCPSVDLPACSVYTPLLAHHEHAGHAHRAQRRVICMHWSTHSVSRLRNPCATRAYTAAALLAPSLHPQPGAVHSATAASPTQRQRYRKRRGGQMKRNKRTHESMTTDSSPPPLPTSFVWIQGTHLEGEAHTSASDSQARRAAEKNKGRPGRAKEKRESRGSWGDRMEQRRDLLPYRENEDREGPAAAR